jgi:hypothetical protein
MGRMGTFNKNGDVPRLKLPGDHESVATVISAATQHDHGPGGLGCPFVIEALNLEGCEKPSILHEHGPSQTTALTGNPVQLTGLLTG